MKKIKGLLLLALTLVAVLTLVGCGKSADTAAESNAIVYKGTSSVGMGGSTDVTLLIDGDTFTIETTKPRGTGTVAVADGVITLTYTDPATKSDGGEFVLTGTVSSDDLTAADTVITIEEVIYQINMGEGPTEMNLESVEFTQE